jgi:hypothetical protein
MSGTLPFKSVGVKEQGAPAADPCSRVIERLEMGRKQMMWMAPTPGI